MKTPDAPEHLRPATRAWWTSVVTDWMLEPHHIRLLTMLGATSDRWEEAREALDKHGTT